MKNEAPQFVPVRRDLLVRELSDEVVLYDKGTSKAHCLNQTAAAVWKLCNGERSVAEIARGLQQILPVPGDEGLVWIALCQLSKSGLLQNEIPPLIKRDVLSRRELVRRMGIAATMALPIATSILVPTPAAAVSPPLKSGRQVPSRR